MNEVTGHSIGGKGPLKVGSATVTLFVLQVTTGDGHRLPSDDPSTYLPPCFIDSKIILI